MKKFFILFLALTFVLSMGTFVFADDGGAINSMKAGSSVSIGGDARVRGVWQNNYDMIDTEAANGANDADDAWIDERIRLKITADVGNGIKVISRLTSDTDVWNTTAGTTSGTIAVDYMYLHIPVSNLVIDAGNMHRKWGNKLLMWDVGRDTLQVTTNVGDTQIGLYTDKITETRATSTARNLNDSNNYGLFVNHTAANLAAGIHAINQRDDRGPDNSVSDKGKGTQIDAYLNTSVGAITIAAEVARKSGNMNTDTSNKKPLAGFIYAATDVGAINVNVFAAVLKNGFAADKHLTPTVFFGTDNPTAIANVMAAAGSTTKAFALGAGTDITSDISVSAKLAYFDLENLSAAFRAGTTAVAPTKAGDESAIEVDLGVKYKLADNAVYSVDLGYLRPDNITLADDNAIALAHKVEVSF